MQYWHLGDRVWNSNSKLLMTFLNMSIRHSFFHTCRHRHSRVIFPSGWFCHSSANQFLVFLNTINRDQKGLSVNQRSENNVSTGTGKTTSRNTFELFGSVNTGTGSFSKNIFNHKNLQLLISGYEDYFKHRRLTLTLTFYGMKRNLWGIKIKTAVWEKFARQR